MIDVQCTSCHTRYRIDERVLPEETPTFKCSRCGHVFSAEPPARKARIRIAQPEPKVPRQRPPARRAPAPQEHQAANDAPATEPDARAADALEASAEAFESAAPKSDTDELLNRTFERAGETAPPGESLSFDFCDTESEPALLGEDHPGDDDVREHWQVGDQPDSTPSPLPAPRTGRPAMPPSNGGGRADHVARAAVASPPASQPRFATERSYLPDEAAYAEPRGPVRSARSLIALFVVLALLFGGLSLIIVGEPVASARVLNGLPGVGERFERPILPAMRVALLDVRPEYRTIRNGRRALIVSGNARNLSSTPLHTVQIAADLLDEAQRVLAGRATYCGINLSDKMLAEMTPRELDFLQRLEPQKSFAITAGAEARFILVFTDPPAAARNLRIAVTKALPAAQDPNSSR
jgi:predicted Zn finger-like uncharacterized protein